MEIAEIGYALRARRASAGRTIASVAVDAGLSVPYIANLENGRGNPTLSALSALATALGAQLRVELADAGAPAAPGRLPDSLVAYARSPRFTAESARLAEAARAPVVAYRQRLVVAMAGVAALSGRTPVDLDWHRILDVVVLLGHRTPGSGDLT